jgi:hypothetical protein
VELLDDFAVGVGFFLSVVVFFSLFFVALGLGLGLVVAASAKLSEDKVKINAIARDNFFIRSPT